jgi:hypothetical protein
MARATVETVRGTTGGRRGFTLVEALALVGALTLAGAVGGVLGHQPPAGAPSAPASAQPPAGGGQPAPNPVSALAKARSSARQLKCSTQVRGIVQSMVVWASNDKSMYPLPSDLDTGDQTVADVGRAKDTTANIFSLLIWNGHILPEICICPDEQNKSIKNYRKYEYAAPAKAVKPPNALWDPAFGADFIAAKGNVSYAHLQPSGDFVPTGKKDANGKPILEPTGRMKMWSDTYAANEALISDRGPEIESVTFDRPEDPAGAKVKTKLAASSTLKIHGGPDSWEGNVGYNDGHVDFVTTLGPTPQPTLRTYRDKDDKPRWDSIFFDEPDDAKSENTYMGIFVKAGKTPKDFKGIWD